MQKQYLIVVEETEVVRYARSYIIEAGSEEEARERAISGEIAPASDKAVGRDLLEEPNILAVSPLNEEGQE